MSEASGLPFTISRELNMSKTHDIIIIAAQCAEGQKYIKGQA